MEQAQFSTIRGAMSAANGAAIAIEGAYNFADMFISVDLEASQTCYRITSTKSGNFGN
jgi:hypothetical protein